MFYYRLELLYIAPAVARGYVFSIHSHFFFKNFSLYLDYLYLDTNIIKNTGIFIEIVLLDTPLPYVGVSVGTVTHKQRPEAKDLQEKACTGLIVQILGIDN